MKTILLHGDLTRKRLQTFLEELKRYIEYGESITIVIDSNGGNLQETLKIIAVMEQHRSLFTAKIYHAESSAALIALACACIIMIPTAELVIHLPVIRLSSVDISSEGYIPKKAHEDMQLAVKITNAFLANFPAFPRSEFEKLYTVEQLRLNAQNCLKYRIADVIE